MLDSTDPEANKMVRDAKRRDVIEHCRILACHRPFVYATHNEVMDDIMVVALARPNDLTLHHHHHIVAYDTHGEVMVEVMAENAP